MISQEYDEWESCRDGCGCDIFCRREMADPAWRKKMGFKEEEENMGPVPSGYGQNSGWAPLPPGYPRRQSDGHVIVSDGAGTVLRVVGNTPEAEVARVKQAEQRKGKKMATKKIKTTTPRVPQLLEIVSPDTESVVVKLKDLVPGEMFRYPAGNPSAIYMVQDLSTAKVGRWEHKGSRVFCPDTHISSIALSSGKVFIEDKEKVIIPVLGTLEFKDSV